MSCTLVILAAGLGTRYLGGIKQLEPFGPNGEVIMDYSIYDAVEAGFDKVIFVIRKNIKSAFDKMIGNRISQYVNIEYVYQELDCLPQGFNLPNNRIKPWGHGHAVCCCKGVINEPFAIINADDFYGKQSFVNLYNFLQEEHTKEKINIAMSGFILKNTLSEFGSVNRGVCINNGDILVDVEETYNIHRTQNGQVVCGKDSLKQLDENCCVSMNMWGCEPKFIDRLEQMFEDFLKENINDENAEFLLPAGIDRMIKSSEAECKILKTNDKWFGVTYVQDKPKVQKEIRELIDAGIYPSNLWGTI